MFAAGRMVLRLSFGSHGTLVAVSAPLMMPLRDSDIPMNVPFTFRNKQPLPLKWQWLFITKQVAVVVYYETGVACATPSQQVCWKFGQ